MTIDRHDPEVGIKVVPMVIESEESPVEEPPAPVERRKTPVLGGIAAVFAGLMVVAVIVAMAVATAGDYRLSTIIAYCCIGLSVLGVLGGVVAVILDLGRRLGIAALVVGVLANPLVLLVVLRFVSGAQGG